MADAPPDESDLCLRCGRPVPQDEPCMNVEWVPPDDPDAVTRRVIHIDCFPTWTERPRLVERARRSLLEHERGDPQWHKAFDDGHAVVVTDAARQARVYVHASLSGYHVDRQDWERWLAAAAPASHPPLLTEHLMRAKRSLQVTAPTFDALAARIDWAAKRPVVNAHAAEVREAEQREARRLEAIEARNRPHNAACERLMDRLAAGSLTCPHCGQHSQNYRLSQPRWPPIRLDVLCRACGWPVDPADVP